MVLAVIDYFSKYDSDIKQSIEVKKMKPIEAIVHFVYLYAVYCENYPAITAITQSFDILRIDPYFSEKVKSIYLTRINFISDKIKLAQENGEINPDISSKNLAIMIMGLFRESCLNWRMQEYNYSFRKQVLSTFKFIGKPLRFNPTLLY